VWRGIQYLKNEKEEGSCKPAKREGGIGQNKINSIGEKTFGQTKGGKLLKKAHAPHNAHNCRNKGGGVKRKRRKRET